MRRVEQAGVEPVVGKTLLLQGGRLQRLQVRDRRVLGAQAQVPRIRDQALRNQVLADQIRGVQPVVGWLGVSGVVHRAKMVAEL